MKFTDSHCHLTDDAFTPDRPEVLARAREKGVTRLVTIASDVADARAACELANDEDDIWFTAGLHPHEVGASLDTNSVARVREIAQEPRCVAIGETGLDYYYDSSPRRQQRDSFARHIDLAAELAMPLVVHSRNAQSDTAAAIKEGAGNVCGVLHCFSGPHELMDLALQEGWFVSFTGVVTFPSFDPELVRRVPAECYMLETDAPYLAPVPRRGRRNEPAFLPHLAEAVADIRGKPLEKVAQDSWDNASRFFGIAES